MKKLNMCDPSLCNNKYLTTGEGEFIDKDNIKDKCECINKGTCQQIIELLDKGSLQAALVKRDFIKYTDG